MKQNVWVDTIPVKSRQMSATKDRLYYFTTIFQNNLFKYKLKIYTSQQISGSTLLTSYSISWWKFII